MKCRKNKNKGIDFEQQKKAKESKQNKVLKLNTHTLDDGGEKMEPLDCQINELLLLLLFANRKC